MELPTWKCEAHSTDPASPAPLVFVLLEGVAQVGRASTNQRATNWFKVQELRFIGTYNILEGVFYFYL